MIRPRFALAWALALVFAAVARAAIGTALQMQLGNPSSATTDTTNHTHYLISRAQYALDYNDHTNEPNWVSWDLTTADVGSSGRSSFVTDTTLPAGFYQVKTTDYNGVGSLNPVLNRGHMCPSADRSVDDANNLIVFYMSNIVPQTADNNQGPWASFETYCRTLASSGNELLIISGPSTFGGSYLPSGIAAIPGNVWKVVVVVPTGSGTAASRITTATRVIALKIPNIGGIRSAPWQNYIVSAAQIESDTGYTFFSALPATTASVLRLKVDGQTATAPSITTQPGSQAATPGASATFAVTAAGTAPLVYQWNKNGTPITGATNAGYTIGTVQAADSGSYSVTVSNSAGFVTSNTATLTVNVPASTPTVSVQTSNTSVVTGATVTFTTSTTFAPPLTYQWFKNGSAINGATTATYTIQATQLSDTAVYTVSVGSPAGSATSNPVPLIVNSAPIAPTFFVSPASVIATAGKPTNLLVSANGTQPFTYQWRKDGSDIAGANSATLSFANVQFTDAGSYTVVVSNSAGTLTSPPAILTVVSPVIAPTITSQPSAQTAAANATASFTVAASGTAPFTYQWFKDGAVIPGASSATLALTNLDPGDAGNYAALVSNSAGAIVSNAAKLTIATANPGRLVNLSIRTNAGTGTQTLIVGFVVGGAGTRGPKGALLRGAGPSLNAFGVSGFLPDPSLTLFAASDSSFLNGNDDWNGDAQITSVGAQVGAFPFPSAASKDAALAGQLAGGGYTMQVAGASGTTGIALAEIYDSTPAANFFATTPRLVNVSARAQVGTGNDILIAGFVIGGASPCKVLIRGIGPTLTAFGVSGALADPQLALFNNGGTKIQNNDNWNGATDIAGAATSVGAFSLDAGSRDAALLVTLQPGTYTAQVSGVGGTTGVGLVEIYEVP